MPGKGGWPITMGTFVVVPQVTQKPEQTLHALQFFVWAFMNGDALVPQSNFVRLPDLEGAPRGGALMGEAGRLASTHMQRPGAYFEQE